MANDYNLKIVLKLFLSKETCQVNIFSNENRQYYDDRNFGQELKAYVVTG